MGWSDGQSFMPVNAHLVAAGQDKNLLNGSDVKIDNRTLATKRRIDARKEKPALVIEMLKAIKGTVAQAKYVLFDSWFSSPYLILAVNNLGYQVVTRLKNTDKHRYFYQGESRSISSIYGMSKKRRGKSRYLLSVIIEVCHKNSLVPIEAKLVYIRSKSNRKKWIALLSTDLSLTEEDIVALYGKRWDIEVFFKVIKSYLRLTKEFQMRSGRSSALPCLCHMFSIDNVLEEYSIYTERETLPKYE